MTTRHADTWRSDRIERQRGQSDKRCLACKHHNPERFATEVIAAEATHTVLGNRLHWQLLLMSEGTVAADQDQHQ